MSSSVRETPADFDVKLGLSTELLDDSHRLILWLAAFAAWVSVLDLCFRTQRYDWPSVTSALLVGGVASSAAMRRRHPGLARSILTMALAAVYLTAILTRPHGSLRYFGTLILLACSSLLPVASYVLLTAALCAGLALLELLAPSASIGWPAVREAALLMVLTAALTTLSRRHLILALSWASSSTSRMLHLTEELHQRQLVLNRTLRAMDEANERLAMANQRLIEARRSADEARQIKARFAANISHELRTPLNLIVGFTEVMYNTPYVYQDVLLSPEFLLDLGAVYRNAQHLQRLVDDVLDLAQIDTGKIVLQLAEVDMASLVREAADTVHNLATVRGLSVVTEVSPDLPHVYADRTRVKQVLLNLLSNAIRYTESGTVTVKASCNDHEVLCSVTDTGPGIPEEEQKKLFREFERVSTGQASPQRGFGLGLAISKRFIQALGGRIWVESQVGLGSTFTFALPVLYEAPWSNVSEVTTVQPSLLPQQAAKDLVLVVTSNLLAARLFSRYLENYRCLTSRNVSQVQRQIADLQPRGILTDEASGAAIVDQLGRALEETPVLKTPLIVCPMPGEPQIGSLRQAKAYLVKPVTRQDLLDTLRTFGEQIETILVVDDEDDALRLFSHYLQDDVVRPYKVIIAHNGREALGAMSRTMPDLILLDLLMPIMDGYRFLEEIQANPSWADIPVVLVSSRDAQDQRQPIEGWVKARVPRGMDASQLIRAVDDLIRALQPSTRNGS